MRESPCQSWPFYISCAISHTSLQVGACSTPPVPCVQLTVPSVSVPKEQLKNSEQIAASLLFKAVFNSHRASRGLSFLITLSAFGNLVAVLVGQSRMIRECARRVKFLKCSHIVSSPNKDTVQARRYSIPSILGIHATIWDTIGTVFLEVVHDCHHDPRSSSWRCV